MEIDEQVRIEHYNYIGYKLSLWIHSLLGSSFN